MQFWIHSIQRPCPIEHVNWELPCRSSTSCRVSRVFVTAISRLFSMPTVYQLKAQHRTIWTWENLFDVIRRGSYFSSEHFWPPSPTLRIAVSLLVTNMRRRDWKARKTERKQQRKRMKVTKEARRWRQTNFMQIGQLFQSKLGAGVGTHHMAMMMP